MTPEMAIAIALAMTPPSLADHKPRPFAGQSVKAFAPAPPVLWRTDYEVARQQAAKEGRPLLVRFTARWCIHCPTLAKTLESQAILEALTAGRFVCVVVDVDAEPNVAAAWEALPEKARLRKLPTLYRWDQGANAMRRLEGGTWGAETIVREMLAMPRKASVDGCGCSYGRTCACWAAGWTCYCEDWPIVTSAR